MGVWKGGGGKAAGMGGGGGKKDQLFTWTKGKLETLKTKGIPPFPSFLSSFLESSRNEPEGGGRKGRKGIFFPSSFSPVERRKEFGKEKGEGVAVGPYPSLLSPNLM